MRSDIDLQINYPAYRVEPYRIQIRSMEPEIAVNSKASNIPLRQFFRVTGGNVIHFIQMLLALDPDVYTPHHVEGYPIKK